MRRLSGLVATFALMVVLAPQVGAQTLEGGPNAGMVNGGSTPFNEPYGGFGFGYTQVLPSDTLVFDRWWFWGVTPSVAPATPDGMATPSAAPAQAVEPVQRVAQVPTGKPARPDRSSARARIGARKTYRAAIPPAQALPSGSLYWPAGNTSFPLYSPAQRYGSYGFGYGVSPVGSIDYGSSYKGYLWGN